MMKMNINLEDTNARLNVELPEIRIRSEISIEEALSKRRSIRDYQERPVSLAQVGQLLWAAQGITDPVRGRRTAPSAGARYPLEFYLAVNNVTGLDVGVYHYDPGKHQLKTKLASNRVKDLALAARQEWIAQAAGVIVISAVYQRTTDQYGDRGLQYVHMDVGIAAENVYLQAEALGLGTVFVGAFVDDELHSHIKLSKHEQPLCLLPIGWPLSH
jgi:SagB-type dehydrogenase family enzyme